MKAGDVILTPSGSEHGLSHAPCSLGDLPPVVMGPLPPTPGPADFEFLCGAYRLAPGQAPGYFSAHPAAVVVSPDYGRHPELRWLTALLDSDVTGDVPGSRPGGVVTRAALVDLILVHALRQWQERHRPGPLPPDVHHGERRRTHGRGASGRVESEGRGDHPAGTAGRKPVDVSEFEAEAEFDAAERRIWAGRAEAFRDSFAKLCAHTAPALLDAVGAGPGVRLLDVGTGIGTVAAAACARGAEVTAVDAEPGMVELARRGAPAADVRQAVLPDLPFPADSFDAVVANFVVNHVGRPTAAVTAMRAATRPGGRVAATIWCTPAGAGHELLERAVEAAGAQLPALPRICSAEDFPRTREGFADRFAAAGLEDVTCEPVAWDHLADPEEWWGGAAAGVGLIGQTISRQDPDTVVRIKAAYDDLAREYAGPDGRLVLPYHALLAAGRA